MSRTRPKAFQSLHIISVLALMLTLVAMNTTASAEVCGGLDYVGKCEGTIIQWCENDEVIQLDCADHGAVCSWDPEKEYYTCMDPDEATQACPSENTYSGTCQDEHTVIWCNSDGSFNTMECKEGLVCGWNEEMGYYDCVTASEDNPGADDDLSATPESPEDPESTDASIGAVDAPEEDDFVVSEEETERAAPQDGEEPAFDALAPPAVTPGCRNTANTPVGVGLLLMILFFGGWATRVSRP